ncbi:MAG: hypothetical protein LIO65_07720 [Odoribacter sp.]|nr:hypothetical protein [Odoribacter sp.]
MNRITQDSEPLKYLRELIEQKFGIRPDTVNPVQKLLDGIINFDPKESISLNTIRKIWGYDEHKSSLRASTLDILAKAAQEDDFKSWNEFIQKYQEIKTSLFYFDDSIINDAEEDLSVGEVLILGFSPKRFVKVKYKGFCEFEVIESKGSCFRKGNIIEARWFETTPMPKGLKTENEIDQLDIIGVLGNERISVFYGNMGQE